MSLLVTIIHIVVDGVDTLLWAGVLALGTTAGGCTLDRSIVNHVTVLLAVSFIVIEDVVQTFIM